MKNLVKLMSVVVLLTANGMNSQTTPELPTPPSTSTVIVENSSSSYSSISDDSGRSSSSSISVKETNSSYKFRASFNDDSTTRVRSFLQKELKNKRFTNTNNSSFWVLLKKNEEIFECKVREGSVRIYVNKEMASKKFQKDIEEIGERLKYVINRGSSEDAKKERKTLAKRREILAKRRLEQAKRNYEKAKRTYEREQ